MRTTYGHFSRARAPQCFRRAARAIYYYADSVTIMPSTKADGHCLPGMRALMPRSPRHIVRWGAHQRGRWGLLRHFSPLHAGIPHDIFSQISASRIFHARKGHSMPSRLKLSAHDERVAAGLCDIIFFRRSIHALTERLSITIFINTTCTAHVTCKWAEQQSSPSKHARARLKICSKCATFSVVLASRHNVLLKIQQLMRPRFKPTMPLPRSSITITERPRHALRSMQQIPAFSPRLTRTI